MSNKFTPEELKAFREEYCRGASQTQFDLFINEAIARDLRPGPHLFFQLRSVNEWDPEVGAKVKKQKATWMSTIAAFRLISQRSGKDAGRGKTRWIYLDENNAPTIESTIPLPHKDNPQLPREPFACVVPVYRSDYKEPIEIVCRFEAYAVTYNSAAGTVLTEMWQRRGPEQLEKCAECASRRAAYPEELGSLFIPEEFKSEVSEVEENQALTPNQAAAIVPEIVVPKVDQTPAQPTDTPRPGEQPKTAAPPLEPQKAAEEVVAASGTKKKNRGKKADDNRPLSGQSSDQITQEDIEDLQTPRQEIDPVQNAKEAQEFVESVSSFTKEEAVAQGLPEPVDPLPNETQKSEFIARMRALQGNGVDIKSLGDYTLKLSEKTSSKYMTVGDWTRAFENLDAAKAEGKLKELVKGTK